MAIQDTATAEKSLIRAARYVLAVKDLQKSAQYYREKLGCKTDWAYPGWEQLSRDNFIVMLGECTDDVSAFETRNHAYFAYVEVQHVDALFIELHAKGLDMISVPTSQPWGMREFGLRTVDGHRIMFGEEIEG
jgi:catechol 2,3-dioxygenase-like lactoylglutathione lyase family enzyme